VKKKATNNTLLIMLILIYGLSVMCWALFRDPLAPDEAKSIFMGRNVIAERILPCSESMATNNPTSAIESLTCAYPGSVAIAPLVIALADSFAGIYGSRLVGAILGLLLIILVYQIGNTPLHGKRGLITAATFVFLGLPLQLSVTASAGIYVAFFVGFSLLLIESKAESRSGRQRGFLLLLAALLFALAMMTNYITVLFAIPFVLFVFFRYRFAAGSLFFLLPLITILSLYGYLAVLPAWSSLYDTLGLSLPGMWTIPSSQFIYILNWLTMPYLLATFGIFHKEGGKNAFLMMLLASPSFLTPYISSKVGDVHTAVFISLIFLTPPAALGVERMGELFSSHKSMPLVKPFFVSIILIIIWVFGIQQIKELKRESPDLSPAVAFLYQKGSACTTVLVDSDYGSPEYVYRYYLEARIPPARVAPIARGNEKERRDMVVSMRPDYVVVDDYHSVRSFVQACHEYLAQGFTVAKTYQMSLASGVKNVRIFQRGTL
jgi:hypothetical protein